MSITTHYGRITGPVEYTTAGGRTLKIPIGPCIVETADGRSFDISWGARGQSSTALPLQAFQIAQEQGFVVLLRS
jgi:hypothetical protein